MKRLAPFAALAGVAAIMAGCSSVDHAKPADAAAAKPSCPVAWRAGWQRLANRIDAPVYCPAWVPSPLDAQIGSPFSTGASVGKDRSYLAGFIWFERGSGEVHINLRGYPGHTAVPGCREDEQAGTKRIRRTIPCFSDPQKKKQIGPYKVTLYTVNRDADQWHLLYAWRRGGSLYTVSEHVAPPYSHQRVLQNLDRMMRNLVLVSPKG